ncbi:MAG: toll/interleukin-1 receptor domain-containing protein [Opitutaceae bacterium]
MSSAGSPADTSEEVRPSVFLSYASEDRPAARRLRDALNQAGLEVWYDENELGGGDAWDQKIRRQIRECTFFIAVISSTTDQRSEGYFRREWRLAVERTLDMADDMLFLVPIVIDETHEEGARVPEKFLTVQWVRVPDGVANPALDGVTRRLLASVRTPAASPKPRGPRHHPGARIPSQGSPKPPPLPPPATPAPASDDHVPPPMPPFPHLPAEGDRHYLRFVAEILWWVVTAVWLLVRRLPRWIRIVLGIWFVITVVSQCRTGGRDSTPPATRSEKSESKKVRGESTDAAKEKGQDLKKALVDAANELRKESGQVPGGTLAANLTRIGAEIAAGVAKSIPDAPGAPLAVAVGSFSRDPEESPLNRFGQEVRAALLQALDKPMADTSSPPVARVAPRLLAADEGGRSDPELVLLARDRGLRFVLRADPGPAADPNRLTVRLLDANDGRQVWSRSLNASMDATQVSAAVAELLTALQATTTAPAPSVPPAP